MFSFHIYSVYTEYILTASKKIVLLSTAFTIVSPMTRRSPGQKLVNVPMDDKFVSVINDAVEKFNYSDRAKLIREAIAEKLERLGMNVPASIIVTPPRFGKGGRRQKEDKDREQTGQS
jgi:hypothetical protein